jgi:D-aminoacyl-tRNA deacylase
MTTSSGYNQLVVAFVLAKEIYSSLFIFMLFQKKSDSFIMMIMKLVVQRVKKASVTVEKKVISHISHGFLVLVGITGADTKIEADFLSEKLSKLRIMSDSEDKMNLAVADVNGSMLLVSQFTLYGDTKGGNRPSFIKAARPEVAEPLYDYFVEKVKSLGIEVGTGKFGADMKIDAELDGPVTILMGTD